MGEDQKPRDEARELRLITWYLVDRFREAFASGFCCSVVRSTEVVNHALQTLTMRAIRLFDILSEGYAGELKCSARSQLEADLGALSKYFTAWNKSKRVAFSDDKLPGRAVVSGVEECKINEFVARNVQRERTTFAYADVNFFSRLDHADQADVKRLFSFYGKSFDAVKFRNEHRLRGQQYALGVFEVSHEVSVSERDKAPGGTVPMHRTNRWWTWNSSRPRFLHGPWPRELESLWTTRATSLALALTAVLRLKKSCCLMRATSVMLS